MRSAASLFLAAAFFVAQAHADYAFIECADPLLVTGVLTGVVNILLTAGSAADSYTGCPTYCQGTMGTKYSVYQPGLFGLLSNCYCTNIQPTSDHAVAGTNSNGACNGGTYQVNYLGPPANILDFTGCTTGGVPGPGSPASFTTPNADQCFTTCQTYKYLILVPSSGPSFTCQCASFLTPGSAATCNVGVQNIYNNAAIAPSGGARRRRDHEMQERIAKYNGPCIPPYETCMVPNEEHGWECIDTSIHLESCGGCLHGFFGQPNRNASGVDCTIGAHRHGAGCAGGVCTHWRCAPGWVLEGTRCVPRSDANQTRRRR
ncbi:hypothetical protein CspeluHIS016_0103610 [Cutaneotrichosporon spelunceum]|uniref:Protein CPL1-like domain-containing protein n=1 Tax=Cutaneotrichosporon spelunceum TaxID=1672016 RepID=A0AAD3TN77_9TREE|nr:hypothetical protein CspeluHIS016_0103610 [Cutaneotrichosporon spelunceum]